MAGRTILVVVDPTVEAQPAAERAALIARAASADLELFICDYDPEIEAGMVSTVWIDQPAKETLMRVLEDKLEALAAPLREAGLNVSVDVHWDHPLDAGIVRKIVESTPWLVVKDTHHHNVLKRTVLSNTDWHLIRQCPVPLYLVKPENPPARPKIFAAVDPVHEHDKPASLDHAIVKLAEEMAGYLSGELHVVHTYAVPSSLVALEGVPVTHIFDAIETEHRDAFTAFLAPYSVAQGNAHFVEGLPQEKLPEMTADPDAGLIVMGAVSRRGLDRIFVGSTAERVLDRLSCDLLIVKQASFESSSS